MLVNAGEEDISFENNVDAESAPPVEFYYTNELVPSGADVPSPSLSDVNCCDCLIPCKENPHCACKSHQKQKFEDDRAIQLLIDKDEGAQAQWKNTKYPTNTGFLYKENGTLIELLPVYECNALCRCNEDCVNRRSQRPRGFPLTIFKTAERGWGVRYDGKTTLPGHSFIGIYAGEVLTENEADQRGRTYDRSNRTYLYNLDSAHLRTACEKINGRPFNEEEDECCKYVMDAHHVGNFTRFFNHCCQPNLVVVPLYVDNVNPFIYKTAFFTWRDVQPGEELTFNYGPGITGNEEGIAGNTGKFALCKCGARSCKGWQLSRLAL
ncbi:SET domain-containing protein [Cylindrobasidium torrendii FP15055 ss-10]|uniref:SET domain-containing protein n=1 Tax=Cylindrobasidium torrendii FP15055 ss-10 TaxID=1314674 RepID=A0A0D7BID0_9AGAR|nr:SET domain-containing protein [Cylindrobasidium torrendii FP15055 ss-10]